jgi:hypothetical protein
VRGVFEREGAAVHVNSVAGFRPLFRQSGRAISWFLLRRALEERGCASDEEEGEKEKQASQE